MSKGQILVVEDEFITASDIKRSLVKMGYDVPATVDNGPGAIEKAGEHKPDLVLMDINLIGPMNGIEAARQIRERYGIPVIYLTAQSDDATVEKAVSSDPFGYIIKPLEERTLKTNIQVALYKHAMEKKLKEQDRIIRTLINTTSDGAVLLDLEGKVLAINAAFAERLGKSPDAIQNTIIYEFIQTGGISKQLAEELVNYRKGSLIRMEEEIKGKKYDTRIYPAVDEFGVVTTIAVFCHDITLLKQAESDLKLANEKLTSEKEHLLLLNAALNNMSDCAVLTDIVGNIVYVNATFEKKLGIPFADVKGKFIAELAHPENMYHLSKDYFLNYKTDQDSVGNFAVKNKYGVKVSMSIKGKAVLDEEMSGRTHPKYFLFVLRDHL
jgi:PAS domain S-box-containing protein